MNEKIRLFIEKQKEKRTLEKEVEKLRNQQVWAEYNYQGTPGGSQEGLNQITKQYEDKIAKLYENSR